MKLKWNLNWFELELDLFFIFFRKGSKNWSTVLRWDAIIAIKFCFSKRVEIAKLVLWRLMGQTSRRKNKCKIHAYIYTYIWYGQELFILELCWRHTHVMFGLLVRLLLVWKTNTARVLIFKELRSSRVYWTYSQH